MENYKEHSAELYFAIKEATKEIKQNKKYFTRNIKQQRQANNNTKNIFTNVKLGV